MIKGIIFDFDGVIANTMTTVEASLRIMAKKHDRSVNYSVEEFRKMTAKELFDEAKIKRWQIPKYLKEVRQIMFDYLNLASVFPGIKNALNKLEKDYKLAILSSTRPDIIQIFFEKNNIKNGFYPFITGTNLWSKKRFIKRIIRKWKMKKDEVIYIGDEERDITAAQKAKVRIIAVSWGFQHRDLLARHNPNYLIDKPSDLVKTIKGIK